MAGVLIFGDVAGGQLVPVAMEAAAAGAGLAEALGEPLLGALIGADLNAAAEQFRGGFSALYLIEGVHYRPYTAKAYMNAAQAAIDACSPSVVLFPHTLETREWVPRLAAHLDTGLVMDCTVLAAEGSDLVVTKPVYGGGVLGEFVVRGAPRMATIRNGSFGSSANSGAPHPAPLPSSPALLPRGEGSVVLPAGAGRFMGGGPSATAAGKVVRLDVAAPGPGRVTLLDEAAAAAGGGLRLKDAKIIVAGGRGLGGPDNWHFVSETASALGAAVGCSRPIADSGWVPSSHQVGLSGTSVTPELYIAVGISGAVQHLAGISNASTVIAINVDPEADIFTRANYGVVGDYREVLPAFIERVRQLRS
ncbi:MAG: electron transfer flavoprotein subunit alpha/FixB family protein [Betaproteobacteria bacterium]|nr:electron transfer flavoprotein subunit alpha/FixB family protein [Betaproteobacteria bacterium]MBI3054683.1 electron transfer flavoprotein subunit alpha/FixB family protein [Betaproteobacteria bacterium]